MKNWFNKKLILNPDQRTLGINFRVFGLDFTVVLLGWLNDWKMVDLRIPVNYGVFLQVWFCLLSVGRLPASAFDNVEINA